MHHKLTTQVARNSSCIHSHVMGLLLCKLVTQTNTQTQKHLNNVTKSNHT